MNAVFSSIQEMLALHFASAVSPISCVPECRGGAIILRVGVQILLQAKRAEIFGGCPPTYDILRVQQLQRHTESLSDSVTQEYAC